MSNGLSLSVVIFAYNEADNLRPVVAAAREALEQLVGGALQRFELVLVDDGSHDGTGTEIDALAAEDEHIVAVHHPRNRGIGAAVRSGFAAATLEHVSLLPADGQVQVDAITRLLPLVAAGADLAVGYFTQRQAVDGLFRIVLSRGLRFGMRLALGTRESMDGVYVLRRRLLERVRPRSETFFVNLEIPVRAVRLGLDVRFAEVPVHPRRSGSSKVVGTRRILRVMGEVLQLRLRLLAEALPSRGQRGAR